MSTLNKLLMRASLEEHESEVTRGMDEEQIALVTEADVEVPPVNEESAVLEADEVEEVVEQIEEQVEENTERREEIAEEQDYVEELETERAAVEQYIGIIESGLKTKTYSPQFMAACQIKLQGMGASGVNVPSLENYGVDDFEGFYKASLESFSGFMKRINDAITAYDRTTTAEIKKWSEATDTESHKEVLSIVTTLLAKTPTADVVVKGKSFSLDYHCAKTKHSTVLESLKHDAKSATAFINKGLPAITTAIAEVEKIINDGVMKGGPGETRAILERVLKIKSPKDVFADLNPDDFMAGGLMLEFKETKLKGEDAVRDAIAGLAVSVPKVDGVRTTDKGQAEVTVAASEFAAILRQSQINLALADKITKATIAQIKPIASRLKDLRTRAAKGANATSWSENKELNMLADAFAKMLKNAVDVSWVVPTTLVDNVYNAVDLIKD